MLGIRYANMASSRRSMDYFFALSIMENISDKLDEASRIHTPPHQPMADLIDAFSLCNKAMSGDMKSINRIFEIKAKVLVSISIMTNHIVAERHDVVTVDHCAILDPVLVKRDWGVVHPHANIHCCIRWKKHAKAIAPAATVARTGCCIDPSCCSAWS